MALKRPPVSTPRLYAQDGKGFDAIVHAHYFIGSFDLWVTEYDPADDEAFGFTCMGDPQNAELGYTSLAEVEAARLPINVNGRRIPGVLRIEKETNWTPRTLRSILSARADLAHKVPSS